MRILVIADIHANWPALQAIEERFDACLFVGDLVEYATEPLPCLRWLREHATATVRGNHDHAVAQRILPRKRHGLHGLAAETRLHHWNQLGAAEIKYLARMPVTCRVKLGDRTFFLVHATPRDPFDEYVRDDPGTWAQRLAEVDADVVCVGHTHIPFVLNLGEKIVLNPGSVGQPRDGDPRCSYAVIENGRIEIRRVAYDIDATLMSMRAAGLSADVLDLAEQMLRTGGRLNSIGTAVPRE